jgi:dephospho-CoA kinase
MHKIGLTGGIGSGKSEATRIFSNHGIKVIDLDIIAKNLTKKNAQGYSSIVSCFGNKFLNSDEEIDRKKLRREIFENNKIKKEVESILHPLIFKNCIDQIKLLDEANYIILVVPLLFETTKYERVIDESLLIDCSEKLQIKRISKRDGADPELINLILKSQFNRNERVAKADKIILNDDSLDALSSKIRKYHENMLKKIG